MRLRATFVALAAILFAGALAATTVKIFQIQGASAFLSGSFEGVRLDDEGALTLGAERERIGRLSEPFAYSAVALPDGWAVGTGNDGKVYQVASNGTVSELLDAPEPDIFALWADADGTLFAGSSPDGKVYRIRNGKAEAFFDPRATYIWAIARGSDGVLWVATGVEGKLFRVEADGKGEVAWDATEPHLRSLLPLPGGDLLIGTVGEGRVVRRAARDGSITTLYDSSLAEVVALSRSGGGTLYAALLASEASFVELEPRSTKESGEKDSKGDGASAAPESEDGAAVAAGTRAAGARGPRSELIRLDGAGISESLWSSQEETLYALAADGERLWLATGAEGNLYSLFDGSVRFEQKFDERQIVGLVPGANGPAILTTNEAALYRATRRSRASGKFTSSVADAAQPARFGLFRWSGEKPAGSRLELSFRAGISAIPDESWSDWSAAVDAGSASGSELAIPERIAGRYVQWRVEMTAGEGGVAPRIDSAELSYRQLNQRPKIDRFGAMEPGQILVPANFNPSDQVYEPAAPNRDGIFVPLKPAASGADARTKTLWKRGMRTLRWRATDPNGDALRARLALGRDGARADGREWVTIVEDLDEDSYGFDAAALPDGRYRFRLEIDDARDNPGGGAMTATEISDPVVIDHTPPRRRGVDRRGGGLRLEIADDWNPLREAQISIDGGEWRDIAPVDGLLDGRSETFSLDRIPADSRFVLLRVTDAAWNSATFDLGPELGR